MPVPVVPLPASLTAETPQPELPDPFTWGASLDLNVALLSALAQCNRDKADIRTFENNRAGKPMARLNVEVIPPDSEALNGIFAEIERKYARQPLTPKVIDEMQREATRLVRRMITTKVTFVRD